MPFLSVTICRADASESYKTYHRASQSLSLSLSIKRQHMFASAAPLSDMAVPKALPITASELEERRRQLYKALLQRPANKITRRHSPRGTIWLPHILYLLSSPSRHRRFLYLCALSCPAHLLHLVKQKNFLWAINHEGDRCQHFSLWCVGNVFLSVCPPQQKKPAAGSPPDLVQIARLATTFFVIIWTLNLFLVWLHFG